MNPVPHIIQFGLIRDEVDPDRSFISNTMMRVMNHPEFTGGALPLSLRRITENYEHIRLTRFLPGESTTQRVHILHTFGNSNRDEHIYVDGLNKLWKRDLKPLIDVGFQEKPATGWQSKKHDEIWWDIENDAIWSFNEAFLKSVPGMFQNSWERRNIPRKRAA